jgi:tRNA1(Val) A37 N6-methylase TrmN6
MSFVRNPPEKDALPDTLQITDDAVLGGRIKLKQPRRGHRFGHDAILLAAAVPARAGDFAVDLGAGVGAAGLALAARVGGVRVALVELDPALSALAAENIIRNRFAERARAITLDVGADADAYAAAGLASATADHVLMNPPFNDPARHNASPDARRRRAHLAAGFGPEGWIEAAGRLLRPSGMLTMIWRAEGLVPVLSALHDKFGAVSVLPVHPSAEQPAIRIIARAVKGSRAPLALLPGLMLADENGKPSPAANAVLRDAAALAPPPD